MASPAKVRPNGPSLYGQYVSAGSSSPRTTPSRPLFPGFLAATDDADFDLEYAKHASPRSSSSSPRADSPSGLPYLECMDSSIAGPSLFSSAVRDPALKAYSPTVPSPHRAVNRPPPLSLSAEKSPRSPGPRRRPSPLLLGKAKEAMGLDEELQIQRDQDPPLSAISIISDDRSSLSHELQDLSLLRNTVRQNLLARPVDSPLTGSDSERESSGFRTPEMIPVSGEDSTSVSDVVKRLQASPQLLILDVRPLGSFLDSHFPRSANLSIPSLIQKRFRKSNGTQATSWDTLGGFVSTQAGREVWDNLDLLKPLDVVVIGLTAVDELAKLLHATMSRLVKEKGTVKILLGGWRAVMSSGEAMGQLVYGEHSVQGQRPSLATSFPPPKSAPAFDICPPPIPPSSPPQISHHPSMPSLRAEGTKRNIPSLSINVGQNSSSRRQPKLSLHLDKPLRSATLGSFPHDMPPPTPGVGAPSLLSIDQASLPPRSPGFSLSIPKTGRLSSFQTLCHAQSKLPPSPSSFGDVKRVIGDDNGPSRTPGSPWTSRSTARPGYISRSSSSYLSPDSIDGLNDEALTTASRNGLSPFIVSTILPSFLYLGPEIASEEDVETLRNMGVQRILNVALECDDDAGLGLKDTFKYYRVPMRDIVEESGVGEGMRQSCDFLDDARLHSAPTYVHCKAGKSRSVTVVLAYLIHANAWTLKTAYAYVAERRRGISPNIGFVAELMQFEESELGLKQSGGVHGEGGGNAGGAGRKGGKEEEDSSAQPKSNPRYMRESLPPAWSHSVDSIRPPKVSPVGERTADGEEAQKDEDTGRRPVGDEREVRKNGQWVHHRRAPVDRTTLQPGRRVSKAGLESLRPLNTTSSPKPSPAPSPGVGGGAATPGSDGPLRWI